MAVRIIEGDAAEVLAGLEAESVDALVTDPPAGIGFMGKEWDDFRRSRNDADAGRDSVHGRTSRHAPEYARRSRDAFVTWLAGVMREALRVLKPGAHALVWAIPRTSHWTSTAIEDAGFEIRDVITHHFGSGFPKSLDVSKAIDAAAGVDREVIGPAAHIHSRGKATAFPKRPGEDTVEQSGRTVRQDQPMLTVPTTDAAKRWEGFGTSLKPGTEHWILARKPLDGTVAANVIEHGTGGINVDVCRVQYRDEADRRDETRGVHVGGAYQHPAGAAFKKETNPVTAAHNAGRWPTNLLLTHTARCDDAGCMACCPVFQIGEQSGVGTSGKMPAGTKRKNTAGYKGAMPDVTATDTIADTGTAARFFPTFKYEPKPSTAERETGVEHLAKDGKRGNAHPTVKSVALMQWLCRLITPPRGVVLDCFCGSGSTGMAAQREGFNFIGIELDPKSAAVARDRIRGDAPLFAEVT